MELKKVLAGIAVICIVLTFAAIYTMGNNGWRWNLPRELLVKIDFDKIGENIDDMLADGYTNVRSGNSRDGEPSYYVLGRADDENATPMIYVYWTNAKTDNAEMNDIQYDAHTIFVLNMDSTVGNKDQYRFKQEITIRNGRNRIWMIYYTKNFCAGRQQVIDYLSQFCDCYCID